MNPNCSLSPIRSAVPLEDPGEDLVVERSDIEFFDLASDSVGVQIKVRNSSDHTSPPRSMVVCSAPLGAFLPWRYLTTLTIPSLRPGAKVLVETTATRPRSLPLGRIDRIPPSSLVAALLEDDHAEDNTRSKRVAPSIFAFCSPSTWNWVGNLYVFLNHHGVERHLASGLRVQPGKLNMALFMVGDYRSDMYAFRILGDGAAWAARLIAATSRTRNLLSLNDGSELEQSHWIPSSETQLVRLLFQPPANCRRGKIDVEVSQLSTRRKALVEFSLDPAAQGPGCFVV